MKRLTLIFVLSLFFALPAVSKFLVQKSSLEQNSIEGDSIVIDKDFYKRLVEFDKHLKSEAERRRAEADSIERVMAEVRSTLRIACVGDMVLGLNYPTQMFAPNDGRNLLDDVRSYLVDADLALGNLEGVLLDSGGVPRYSSGSTNAHMFRMPERYAERFVEAGFDFLSMANNHTLDFGVDAISSTMNALKKAGIAYAGVANMCEIAVIERNSLRIGLCAFAPNLMMCNLHDLKLGEKLVKSLREEHKCDIVIVSIHGGAEGSSAYRVPRQNETFIGYSRGNVYAFAHRCVDAGADLVYGHGPHVVRGMELYKGRLIAYSLGNFCTPFGMNLRGRCGYSPILLVDISRDGEFRGGRIISAIQPYHKGPKLDSTGVVIREIQNLSRIDFPESKLRISDDGSFYVVE